MNWMALRSRQSVSWCLRILAAGVVIAGTVLSRSSAAVEINGWGDLRGFRLDGELMPVTTSLRTYGPDGRQIAYTGHWQQRDIHFTRDGDKHIYDAKFGFRSRGGFSYHYVIEDMGEDAAQMQIQARSSTDADLGRLTFRIAVPLEDYGAGSVELIDPQLPTTRLSEISAAGPATNHLYLDGVASGFRFTAARRHLEVDFDKPRHVQVRDLSDSKGDQVFAEVELHAGSVKAGDVINASMTLHAGGEINHQPAHLTLKSSDSGEAFEGIGGNLVFGLNAPITSDNLAKLRIIWARIAMPLKIWEPQEVADPTSGELAANDTPENDIGTSLRMAKTLQARGIRLIISLWVPPLWALNNPDPEHPYASGRIVNSAKWDALVRSIGSYLLYAKQQYGVEPDLFSFNESDLGVTIKLTPQENRDVIKKLGTYLASMGLKTKLLLGDVSYPGPIEFIRPAASDPQAMQYVGAISYHSWNGATLKELAAWHTAAAQLNLPLLVDEEGTDSDAYLYPYVLQELPYAIDEAGYCLDVLSQSQPQTVMPWELTTDYPLGTLNGSDVVPSKRFWFLKQLTSITAPGALHQEIVGDQPIVHAAAFSDAGGNEYSIHIVNDGASRDATVSGIPAAVGQLDCYITDATRSFQKLNPLIVTAGSAQLQLPEMCIISLTNRKVADNDSN